MSVLVGNHTKLVVQGMTGSAGDESVNHDHYLYGAPKVQE